MIDIVVPALYGALESLAAKIVDASNEKELVKTLTTKENESENV